jgi:tape measure domain-containing protein
MTTITALNVRLGMDVSNFSEGANLAKNEVTKVATIMRQSVPPAEKYKQELDLLNRAFSESGKKSKEYANAVEHLKRKHQEVAPAIRDTAKASKEAGSSATSAMSSIKGMAAAYLSVQTIAKSINLASQVEDATIAFEVLTGSAKDGALIFEQIRQFAAESPITFSGATEAAKTMMSFGVAAQDVQKNLQMLSDVTGGNNDRFKMLSLAFSQMSASGRLMGQDLLQMVNAGFNPLQQISKTTGESLLELKERMGEGAISSEEVRQAFEDATAEGGMFHGMTERLSETVSGKLNIALSDMEQKLAEVGESMGPMIVQLLDGFKQIEPVLKAIMNLIEGIAQGLGFTIAAWTDIVNSVSNFEIDMTATNKFLDDLEKREREKADAALGQIQHEFENKLNNVDEVKHAEMKAAREAEAARLKALEDEAKAAEKQAKADERFLIDRNKKDYEAAMKRKQEGERAAQKAERAWQKELQDARSAAMAFFDEQQKQNEQRRADVAKGPGTGMESGSAEAVKFAADAVNARIAGAAVPNDPAATNREIAAKTAELLIAQREANARADRQIQLAERQLKEMEENGFRRLR